MAGWAQIAAYFGFVEFSGGFDDYKTGTPGDYGFKVLTSSDPEEKTKKLSAELANGRLAMMAIIGMFFQDCHEMAAKNDCHKPNSRVAARFYLGIHSKTMICSLRLIKINIIVNVRTLIISIFQHLMRCCLQASFKIARCVASTEQACDASDRMVWPEAPGVTGPTTLLLHCEHSRTSSVCRPVKYIKVAPCCALVVLAEELAVGYAFLQYTWYTYSVIYFIDTYTDMSITCI